MTVTKGSFRFSDAPMQRDRTAGWRFVREADEVVQDADGTWYLTSFEAVRFAHRNPDLEVAPGFVPETVWPSGTFHLRSLPLVFPASTGALSSPS